MASLALLLTAPDARAGTYAITYSGGQSVSTGVNAPGGTNASPYSVNSNGSGTYGGGGATSWTAPGNSVTCSGGITATATWQPSGPGDDPPASVIVQETGTASWSGTGISVPTGACSDGLGDAEVDTTTPPPHPGPPTSVSGVSSGTHYSVKSNPGQSFQLTPTPGANVSCGAVTPGGGNASVSYMASLSPVTISLGGTLTDSNTHQPILDSSGNEQALTGQRITATLNGIPGNFTVTKYTWSGVGSAFKNYDPTLTSNQLVQLGSTDLSGPASGSSGVSPLAFYDGKQESLTVTCAIMMTAPDGTTLSLTATAPTLDEQKPTVSWGITTGFVQHVQNPSGQRGYQLMPVPGSTQAGGEAWNNVKIVVPAPFTAYMMTGGSGCFAQLVTPDTEITNDDPTKNPTFSNNKQQGLDNSFPYKGYTWGASSPGASFDGPALFYENYNSSGYAGYRQALESDAFTTWVMYQPPGGVWVPLQSYDWDWSFTSKWDGSQNLWNLFRARPASAADDPGYKGTDTSTPPLWKLVQNNS